MNINKVTNCYVDLDLPSGTLWAKCNYGANKEIEDGCHFTWDDAMRLPIKLPTKEQFEELLKYTKHQWIENTILGKNGMLFISKVDPLKYIFIPASGYTDMCNCFNDEDSFGYVWSSSINSNHPYFAWYLQFSNSVIAVHSGNRYNSLSVRGVISK